jgi:transposase
MNFIGVDLHKKSITVCIWNPDGPCKFHRFACDEVLKISSFFNGLKPFQVSIEATASYHWFVELLEPMADKIVLAHPKKMRIIAESRNKSDRVDARVIAEFLANGWTPLAYRPTPRQREHRTLVRHRQFLIRERTMVRNKIRRIASDYNADRRDLFTKNGLEYLSKFVPFNASERFAVDQLLEQLETFDEQIQATGRKIREFAAAAPEREARHRAVLRSIPGVGEITSEVVIAELGDVERFHSARQVVAYAGIAPGRRQSSDKSHDLPISKQGSGLLRWVLVEAAWQLVRRSAYWAGIYAALSRRRGKRRAIVAIARRLLGVMVALLRSEQEYREPPIPQLAA